MQTTNVSEPSVIGSFDVLHGLLKLVVKWVVIMQCEMFSMTVDGYQVLIKKDKK